MFGDRRNRELLDAAGAQHVFGGGQLFVQGRPAAGLLRGTEALLGVLLAHRTDVTARGQG